MEILESLQGRYEYLRSSNLDSYLSALGVGLVLRKVHSVAQPELEISYSEQNQKWTIHMESIFHQHVLSIKFGEEIDGETFDARPCKVTLLPNEDGTKLILRQRCDKGPDVTTSFGRNHENHLIVHMTSLGHNATQIFKLISPLPIPIGEEDGEPN